MKRNESAGRRSRLVLFFLIRILLVTWIPLILLIVVFFATSLRAQREQIIDGNVKLFESSINNYDFIFDNFFVSSGDLLYLAEAHRLAQDPMPLDQRPSILVLEREMQRIASRFDMISHVGLYLSEAQLLLSPDGFQNAISLQEESLESFRVLSNLPGFSNRWIQQHPIKAGFRTRQVVQYVMPLPAGGDRPYGAFIYTFPVDSLLNLFAVQQGDSFFFVSDAPGSVLFGNRDIDFLNRLIRDLDVARLMREPSAQTRVRATDSRLILKKSSPVRSLAYVLVMPENPLDEELSLSPSIMFLAAVVLALSLVLTLLFTNYIADPVAEVISAIDFEVAGDRDSGVSKWSVIFHRLHSGHLADDVSIGRLLADHHTVAQSVVAGLLFRETELSDDLRSLLNEFGLDGPLYACLVIYMPPLGERRTEEIVRGLISRARFAGSLYAVPVTPQTVVVIAGGSSAVVQRAALTGLAQRFAGLLAEQVSDAVVTVGAVVSDPRRLREAYLTALRGLSCAEEGVVDASATRTQAVRYPFAGVRLLLDSVRDGNKAHALRHLDEICATIRSASSNAAPAAVIRVYSALHHDIVRQGFELSAEPDKDHEERLWQLLQTVRVDHHAIEQVLGGEIRDIADSLAAAPAADPGEAIQRVTHYIRENFRRDISLNELAEVAGLTSQYLSTLFKRRRGTTVVSYITDLRLEAARSLLRETNKSVSEIAAEVGYSNPQYFTRVFKRATSMSPLQYRKSEPVSG